MEACGSTHHRAEKLVWLRPDVQFIAVLFAMSDKNDAVGAIRAAVNEQLPRSVLHMHHFGTGPLPWLAWRAIARVFGP